MTTTAPEAPAQAIPDTVDDPAPRRRRARRMRRRWPLRLVVFGVLALVVLGVFGWLLSWQSPVPVRTVIVTGAAIDKQAEVKAAAAIVDGTPIRDLDVTGITDRVAAVPGIESVDVILERPSTIDLQVVQRVPFAVTGADGRWTIVDRNGQPITDAGGKRPALPVVSTPGSAAPIPALHALAALPPDLRTKIKTAAVDAQGAVTLTMGSGVTIAWGLPGADALKARAVAAVLQYHPTGIDVSVPQRPALTGQLDLPKRLQAPVDPLQ
ncbi:MAG: cell division protein FtsQ/DivIB [Candidatus Nanopelagicales bacterium]